MQKILLFTITSLMIGISINSAYSEPIILDDNYKIEKFAEGLSFPMSMVFIEEQLFVTEKDSGKIIKISENGILYETPSLVIATDPTYRGLGPTERIEFYKEEIECHCGLLGITYNGENVYVYHTGVAPEIEDRPNIVTKYKFDGTSFVEPETVKTMEGSSRDHAGGVITKGWQGEIYFVIGDQDKYYNIHANVPNGTEEDVASIFMMKDEKIERFAMGIRNSFGMAVDPFTGKLWATENGPAHYDEINIVGKKFNSGWNVLSGPIDRFEKEKRVFEDAHPEGEGYDNLSRLGFEDFEYSDPEFSWEVPVGVTAIEFPNLNSFGDYSQFVFVGDFNTGSIYSFKLNEDRDGFDFSHEGLTDLVYDWDDRFTSEEIFFAKLFPGGISDIEFQDDGMYVSTIFDGTIYKISLKHILPPLKQQKIGIENEKIECVDEHMPIKDKSGKIACVTPRTALSLQEHGWEINSENMPKIVLKNQNLNGLNFEAMDLSYSDFRNVDFKNVNISNVDFSNANLAYADLSGKNLKELNLEGALLRGANLEDANLIKVDLSNKDLTEVILRNQDLSETNLTGSKLVNADFIGTDLAEINLVGVNFFESDLSNKNFQNSNLEDTFFFGTKLHNTNFRDSNLSNAKLINADLTNANLEGANLEGASFEAANLEGANLFETLVKQSNLEGANLSKAILPGDMSNMILKNTKFIGTDLQQIKFTNSIMDYAVFDESEFGQTYFMEATLVEADLSKIKNKNMGDSIITGSVFAHANMTEIIMPKEMYGTNFNNVDASKADFSNGDISLNYFEAANLEGANFEGADLSGRYETFELAKNTLPNFNYNTIQNEINPFPIYQIMEFRDTKDFIIVDTIGYNNFIDANMKNTKFDNANLFYTDMSLANLTNSSFVNADLTDVFLKDANLTNANLEGANLEGANLEGANLEGANLEGANLEGANLNCKNHEICK